MRRSLAVLLVAGACAPADPCKDGVIDHAVALDGTHVEVTLGCDVTGLSPETVHVETFARSSEGALALHTITGARVVVIETDPQIPLATYVVRLDGVRGPDDSLVTASANFVGKGDVETATVTLRVDDRYDENLTSVDVLLTADADGVFTYFSRTVTLVDADGDHVFEGDVPIAVDPLRTVSTADDRLGPDRLAYAARAIAAGGTSLSPLVTFEVTSAAPQVVDLPLLSVPDPPGPEGLVTVHVTVDDRPAQALTDPALRVSIDQSGVFDAAFPTTIPLSDPDGDRLFTADVQVRIDPDRVLGGTTSETFPYVFFVADAGVDYPGVGAEAVAHTEADVDVTIRVGNPDLVPVTFRVDVSAAYLNATGSLRGLFAGEAPFLTGEFSSAEDAFGQNAADSFTGGENVVLELRPRADSPGVWERTLFLPPDRPYGWKVVRCPSGEGCSDLNRHVTSSGRAFATVMKNLVTENRDAQTATDVRVVDPRDPVVTLAGGGTMSFAGADVFVGQGVGAEPDPTGTPDGVTLFKQELPDLVVDVGVEAVVTPVIVVGTWRDVNLPITLAEIVAEDGAFDLNPWDYDAGFVGAAPPSYELAPPPPPPPFVIGDGVVDATATAVPGGGAATMTLHVDFSGSILYVATQDAGEGSDHFLFVSATAPTGALPAPWGKAGAVAFPASAIFLADENDGPFAGWFALGTGDLLEAAGVDSRADLSCAASGGVLEGTVDLAALFGGVPATVYLAVAPYGSADGAAIYSSAQLPATVDGDGDLQADEIAEVTP